ncbi:MAG: tRNA (adenosine(37)-N6)-threonylcarbamoyltransferase complex transferase subunit TsaD [Candidatus Magasanikbacteria bacterium]|jgi:N6-L-threonylcarbamoyladenine synthase|nr:tRNA (adenosine(37)-N6)-threonylcarbamoyltransferase complex transferase subunit TsaD [Candidatus Magasanikbacteria bacterium]MBT4071714.1 tRNA (adenosine(37)-N6)-threonylcarbamoyltransferase complex transferase subunit TsaD [Candidatus Magasanikbacteria bacterium]
MIILGIESSCDDTSVALLQIKNNNITILAEKTASQIEIHKKYGGVIPELAGRKHAEQILPVIEEVLKGQAKPDALAVTAGPGLITGLLVGVEAAKSLSFLLDIPLVRTHHMEGHIYSVLLPEKGTQTPLPDITFPALCLTVSGGHTSLTLMKNHGEYVQIGATRDDAAGETFDKVAKMLGLPYPGGPQISALAKTGNEKAIPFPRPMLKKDTEDFSFAGLKTAALYWLQDHRLEKPCMANIKKLFGRQAVTRQDFCASFEQAIIDVLVIKTLRATKKYNPKTIILGGGVSANKKLQKTLQDEIKKQDQTLEVRIPKSGYSMDNAAMIALAGYYHAKKKEYTTWQDIVADPQWLLTDKS